LVIPVKSKIQILIIEDEVIVGRMLVEAAEDAGHVATHVTNGHDGLSRALSNNFDVIVLDRRLEDGSDGMAILKTLRVEGNFTPVLLISGLSSVEERIAGLRAGANDYLVKPFVLDELLARIEALVRPRKGELATTQLSVGDVDIDLISRTVTRQGQLIKLQPHEYKLLEYMMRRPNEIVTRMQLLSAIWKLKFDPGTLVVEVHLSRLRKKIDGPFAQAILQTVRNTGFVMRPVQWAVNEPAEPGFALADTRQLELEDCAG